MVDVNVHPTKQEVRLSKESSLSRLIINTVAKALERNSNSGDALTNLTNPTDTTSYDQMVFNLNKSNAADIAAPKENDQQAGAEVHENSAGFTVEHRELEVSELNISVSDPDQSLVSPSWHKTSKFRQDCCHLVVHWSKRQMWRMVRRIRFYKPVFLR